MSEIEEAINDIWGKLPEYCEESNPSDEMKNLKSQLQLLNEQLQQSNKYIADAEQRYLEDTTPGNIIIGWDGFLNTTSVNMADDDYNNSRRKVEDSNRIFSLSDDIINQHLNQEDENYIMRIENNNQNGSSHGKSSGKGKRERSSRKRRRKLDRDIYDEDYSI